MFVWITSDNTTHVNKPMIKGLIHKFKNTMIKSDSIKVSTVQYIQQIIAPNVTILNVIIAERLSDTVSLSPLSGFKSTHKWIIQLKKRMFSRERFKDQKLLFTEWLNKKIIVASSYLANRSFCIKILINYMCITHVVKSQILNQ